MPDARRTLRFEDFERIEKLKKEEKTRNTSRRKAQKKGKSLVTDKSKYKTKKSIRPARKITKKRVSVR